MDDAAIEHSPEHRSAARPPLPLGEAARTWARVAALSFGGPAGQIAVMHRILVEEKRWIGERRFLHALNYCMLLPGPEAQQLTIYIGWLMNGLLGGLIAGTLFVLPGFLALMGLSIVYALYGHVGPIAALFFGLKAAVLAIVIQAVTRVARRSLKHPALWAVAAAAFLALALFQVPFPLVILSAGLIGFLGAKAGAAAFQGQSGHGSGQVDKWSDADSLLGETLPAHARPNWRWAARIAAVALVLWLGPTLALGLTLGWDSTFAQIAVFFSKMAVVTFGGAYAVLAYVAQAAVSGFGWLRPGEMLDGLGMAETTPGPLIIVTQFVGFMAAFRHPGALPPLLAGVLGGMLTTWVTFTPCFLWIFFGAPFVESLRQAKALNGALTAITAAVVGVILNLAVWFGLHVLFRETTPVHDLGLKFDLPALRSVDWAALILTGGAAFAIFRLKLGVIPVLLGCSAAGVLTFLLVGPLGGL
ncbi:MAG: chromate efflux transporter [Caulobacteraceae bacterium]